VLFVGRQWGAVCSAFTIALLARELPLAEFGRYTFYLAVFAFVDVIVDFGSGTAVLQKGAHSDPAFAASLAQARRMRLGFAILAVLLLGCVITSFEGPAPWLLVASLYPLARPLETSSLVFQRAIAHGRPVGIRSLIATLRACSILLIVHAGHREAQVLLFTYCAWSVACHGLLFVAARPYLPGIAPSRDVPLRGFLALALPLGIGALLQQAYFYTDNLFVRSLLGVEELGRYNAGARIFSWIALVAAYTTTAALPWMVRRHEEGRLLDATRRLARPLVLGGLAACVLPFAFPQALLELVFGPGFAGAAGPLRWLLAGAICVFAGAPYLTALVASGRSWSVAGITAAGLLVNAIGNRMWIPSEGPLGGIEGAAVATFASEALVLVSSLLVLRRACRPAGMRATSSPGC